MVQNFNADKQPVLQNAELYGQTTSGDALLNRCCRRLFRHCRWTHNIPWLTKSPREDLDLWWSEIWKSRRKDKVENNCAQRTEKPLPATSNISSEHITVLACANAIGRKLPNALVYKTCLPNGYNADSIPDDWLYAVTDSGYINCEVF